MTKTRLQTIDRLFDIIEQIQVSKGSGVTALAQELDMPKSTVHSHLSTLEARGYVEQGTEGKYHLTLQFFALGASVRDYRTIYWNVRPLLMDLAEETGESVSYIVETNGRLVFVGTELGEDAIQTDINPGFMTRLHTTPEGKLLLAHLPEARRERLIEDIDFPIQNSQGKANFRAELDGIREEGVAYSHESIVENVTAIAAPIIDNKETFHGAVVIAGPSLRFGEERLEAIKETLLYKIGEFNVNITYHTSDYTTEPEISTRP